MDAPEPGAGRASPRRALGGLGRLLRIPGRMFDPTKLSPVRLPRLLPLLLVLLLLCCRVCLCCRVAGCAGSSVVAQRAVQGSPAPCWGKMAGASAGRAGCRAPPAPRKAYKSRDTAENGLRAALCVWLRAQVGRKFSDELLPLTNMDLQQRRGNVANP